MGFKFHVGGDWGTYINYFNEIISKDKFQFKVTNDIGWQYLNYFIWKINLPFPILNLVSAIIFLIGIHFNAKLYENYWLFYLILLPYFIFVVGMGYTRQSISIGLLLISISYFIKGEQFKTFLISIILILLGSLFHKSVLIFIILPLLVMRKNIFQFGIIILLMYLFFILTLFLLLDGNMFRRIIYFFQVSYSSFGAYLRTLIYLYWQFFNLFIVNKSRKKFIKKEI